MSRTAVFLVVGALLFLGGGAVLAFGEGMTATTGGTTLGLAGLAAMAWGWWITADRKK